MIFRLVALTILAIAGALVAPAAQAHEGHHRRSEPAVQEAAHYIADRQALAAVAEAASIVACELRAETETAGCVTGCCLAGPNCCPALVSSQRALAPALVGARRLRPGDAPGAESALVEARPRPPRAIV